MKPTCYVRFLRTLMNLIVVLGIPVLIFSMGHRFYEVLTDKQPVITLNNVSVRVLKPNERTLVQDVGKHISFGRENQYNVQLHYHNRDSFRQDFRLLAAALIPACIGVVLVCLLIWWLKGVMDTVGTERVFSQHNVWRIRLIGISVVLIPALTHVPWLLCSSTIIDVLEHTNITYAPVWYFGATGTYLTGLVIVGLAEVFRQGVQLKQEQDLTI